jgi:hypothetical protein
VQIERPERLRVRVLERAEDVVEHVFVLVREHSVRAGEQRAIHTVQTRGLPARDLDQKCSALGAREEAVHAWLRPREIDARPQLRRVQEQRAQAATHGDQAEERCAHLARVPAQEVDLARRSACYHAFGQPYQELVWETAQAW